MKQKKTAQNHNGAKVLTHMLLHHTPHKNMPVYTKTTKMNSYPRYILKQHEEKVVEVKDYQIMAFNNNLINKEQL